MSIDGKINKKFVINGPTMGTRFSAIFYAPENIHIEEIETALCHVVNEVDHQMSTWKPNSDLMRLNATPVGLWKTIPTDLCMVLEMASQIQISSDGAFDVCVGDLVDAWGFGPENDAPSLKLINDCANAPVPEGKPSFEVDFSKNMARRISDRKIDLSGIAKGYGVDQLARILKSYEIFDFLVSIDGEMRALGRHSSGKNWTAAVEKPLIDERQIAKIFELENVSIATSGNYRHFFQIGEQQVSHTMDPALGKPTNNNISSVTVFATSCAKADAWATAIWVNGVSNQTEPCIDKDVLGIFVMFNDGSDLELTIQTNSV